MRSILDPLKVYIDFRAYVHGLSGAELMAAGEKFYRKNPEHKTEICQFFNWIETQRNNFSLPIEKVEVRGSDGKKHGVVRRMMIYDIEYWIQGGQIKSRKSYIPLDSEIQEPLDFKMRSAGEREIGEEG